MYKVLLSIFLLQILLIPSNARQLSSYYTKYAGQIYNQYSKSEEPKKNVILIIADDLGIDMLEVYKDQMKGEGRMEYAVTPTINKFAKEGIRFNRAYSYPTCSPTRAAMLTGKYGFRTGISAPISDLCPHGIEKSDPTIPKYLPDDVNSAAFGKWHLSPMINFTMSPESVVYSNFDYFKGMLLGAALNGDNYTHWDCVDIYGNEHIENEYFTSYITDAAIEWIEENKENPFFIWFAHFAPHTPVHRPPPSLTTNDPGEYIPSDDPKVNIKFANAAVEAMDTEIDRLLKSMDPEVYNNTLIIFLGDNGGDKQFSDGYPFSSHETKTTLHEGGIRVPFIIYGKGVEAKGTTTDSIINVNDVFSTVLDTMDSHYSFDNDTDSISLVPLFKDPSIEIRDYTYVEHYGPGHTCDFATLTLSYGDAIIGKYYKLISSIQYNTSVDGGEIFLMPEFYNLYYDPFEKNNLLAKEKIN